MNLLVSVIIPTYQRLQPLKDALLSLCQQSYPLMEIIVVDDNADKKWNTQVAYIVSEVQPLIHDQSSIQLLTNPQNLGAAQSRNVGIRASHGAYITFLDDDDVYLPDKISVQLASMQAVSADYSLMDLELFNESGQLVERKTHPYANGVSDHESLIRFHLMYHLTGTDTMMFRREYLLQIGCFGSVDIGDEFYLMMNALEAGGRFLYLPQSLVRARVHYDGSGLSGGPLKVQGEEQLFHFKKKYFAKLKPKAVRYICMRHHAVLAFAHLRAKNYRLFLLEAARSFFSSPLGCCQILCKRKQV